MPFGKMPFGPHRDIFRFVSAIGKNEPGKRAGARQSKTESVLGTARETNKTHMLAV